MWKYKTQSLVGIFGLAFGFACFVPMLYWMRYENSYDSFYADAKHIHRIYTFHEQSGKVNELVPEIVEQELHAHFPGIKASTIFFPEINFYSSERMPHIRLRTLNTFNTFFQVFPQVFVSGDSQQPLQSMYNIVLTESAAISLFGDVEKAIGQQIQSLYYFFSPPYTVTAVVKDQPTNTNLPFDALLHHDLLANIKNIPEEYRWKQFTAQLYVKLHTNTDINNLTEQLRSFSSLPNVSNENIEFRIAPISDIRHLLNSEVQYSLKFIDLFVAAGLLLLLGAIFNFLNLHLNIFRQRSRELHLRVIYGSTSEKLILQILFELTCSILIVLLFACCFVFIVRPIFSELLGFEIEILKLIQLFAVCGIGVILLILFIGFIASWKLCRAAEQSSSKKRISKQPVSRHIAVITQLAVSVVFIIAALVVMKQIHFVNRKDLGFDRSGIIQLNGLLPYMKVDLRTALINELTTLPQIKNIVTSNFDPQHNAKTTEMISAVEWPGKSPDEKPIFNVIPTDSRFAEIFRLKMLMGKWFNEGGMQQVVLNEEAVRVMGLSEPIGSIINMSIDDIDIDIALQEYDVKYEVVGVVSDFHTLSLRSRIHPTIFRHTLSSNTPGRITADNILYINTIPNQEQEAIQRITDILPDIDPSFADVRLVTLDELYNSFNNSEQTGLKMFSILATVCLFIALFGIYAIATASTQRRRKEIAIRKIAGAKAKEVVRMFFREYTLQVIIANVIAIPPVFFVMSHWLQGYAYRTNISWWLLLGVTVGVTIVVLITVLGQVLRAANSNPGEVVKNE